MKGIFVRCPNPDCKKNLLKDAYLRPGSGFLCRCFNCGETVDIRAEPGKIIVKLIKELDNLTEDEDNAIIFMKL